MIASICVFKAIERYHFLIIDELGYIPFEREATGLLFQVISSRYERGSIGIATNLAFPNWTEIFPDAMVASAIVDRLIHRRDLRAWPRGALNGAGVQILDAEKGSILNGRFQTQPGSNRCAKNLAA